MKKKWLAVLLVMALLLVACSGLQSGRGQVSESVPVEESVSQEAGSTSALSESAPATSSPHTPSTFVPWALAQSPAYGEPDATQMAMAAPLPFTTLAAFDGLNYTVVNYGMQGDSIQSALYSEEDLFFVSGNALYYCDDSNIYLIREGVCRLAGSNADGLYLIFKDDQVPQLGEPQGMERQASLYYYDPVTGAVNKIISNVQNAVLTGSDHNILFYITAVASDNDQEFQYIINRRDLLTGTDSVVFTDDDYVPFGTPWSAYTIFFELAGDNLLVQMQYPKPSEYPYERYIVLGLDGTFLQSSIEDTVVVATTPLYEMTLAHDRYRYAAFPEPTPVGAYYMRMENNPNGNPWIADYYVMQNGQELCWYKDTQIHSIVPYKNVIYGGSQVYNGQTRTEIDFWEDELLGTFACGGNAYYVLEQKGESPTGLPAENSDWLAVYQATGTVDNPAAIQFLFAFERENPESLGWHHRIYDTMSPYYLAGNFVIACTYDLPNYVVLNSKTGSMSFAGQAEINLWQAEK
ncbi:MAG: hypothetical protein GXY32_03020 [Ruminococcaceae bacterium]|nr:hypothetical protein [Oscillospiraceae bacterium]